MLETDIVKGRHFFYMISGRFPLGEIKPMTGLIEAHIEGAPSVPTEVLDAYPALSSGIKAAILKALERVRTNGSRAALSFLRPLKRTGPMRCIPKF
jgi:hypothetical protein